MNDSGRAPARAPGVSEEHADWRLRALVAEANVALAVERLSAVSHCDECVGCPTHDGLFLSVENAAPQPRRSIYHKQIPVTAADASRGYVLIDVYRVLRAYEVTDQNIGHATKKLLVPGGRSGGKSMQQDVHEAIWSLQRWEEMNREDAAGAAAGDDNTEVAHG